MSDLKSDPMSDPMSDLKSEAWCEHERHLIGEKKKKNECLRVKDK